MKREEVKLLLPIAQAYAEGKTIQMNLNASTKSPKWNDVKEPDFIFDSKYYRIKPESKLVPFTFKDNLLFRDKWIYEKSGKVPGVIRIISYNDANVHTEFQAIGYIYLLDNYCFEDGSPCGKIIEE